VLRRRENQPQIKVFNEVEPNPSTHTVYKGLEMSKNFCFAPKNEVSGCSKNIHIALAASIAEPVLIKLPNLKTQNLYVYQRHQELVLK
jgi:hypothetical protein